MLNICRISSLLRFGTESTVTSRLYRTSAARRAAVITTDDLQAPAAVKATEEGGEVAKKADVPPPPSINTHPIAKRLQDDFFEPPQFWGKEEVKSGRSWRIEELRIKSNEDIHKLWYVLVKERNMLLTMQEAADDEALLMASPERIEKVEDSMKNIEEVVQERNRAYWELEVGDTSYVNRRKAFRKDPFGRWRTIACSEHLVPYWMNTKWRQNNAPGFGKAVTNFNRFFREKKQDIQMKNNFKKAFHVRQLLKRFENIDLEHLQEKFPEVNVQEVKETLVEQTLQERVQGFNQVFYDQAEKKKKKM